MKQQDPAKPVVAVIGTGTMGRGIAQWAATAGHPVLMFDNQDGAADAAAAFVQDILDRSLAKGRLDSATHEAVLGRLMPVRDLQDLAGAEILIEAVLENVAIKCDLFKALEAIINENAILASNTSSLSITEIAAGCSRPERVAGLHFFNPVPLMKVVEVVPGERTDEQVVRRLKAMVEGTTHRAVIASDTPGFLVNHAGRGLGTEGLRIVQEGVATAQDVDRVMTGALGFPMGPFELFDLTGLDISGKVLEYIYDGFFQEPRYRPSPLPRRRIAAGLFGRKSGEGFYRYEDGRKIEASESLPPEAPAAHARLWLGAADPAVRERLVALLKESDAALSRSEKPDPGDAIVLTPLGHDATDSALAGGYDPARVIGIDPLDPAVIRTDGRITMMTNPATDAALANGVESMLRQAGAKVTRIKDSPGFIAQRMVAMIVNVSCEICQQRIASPSDVDDAVRLGLGYPAGPLSLGDRFGPARLLTVLERLQATTGDPRYRPSLWLRRRARLNLSLLSAEA